MFSTFIGKNKIYIHRKSSYEDMILITNQDGIPIDLTGCIIESELRTEDGVLKAVFQCSAPYPPSGSISRKLTKEDTSELVGGDIITHAWGLRVTFPDNSTLPEINGGAMIYESVVE